MFRLDIKNYYEVLLMEMLVDEALFCELDREYLEDLCCITLNKLPVRYVRHLVDTTFFESIDNIESIKTTIRETFIETRETLKNSQKKP